MLSVNNELSQKQRFNMPIPFFSRNGETDRTFGASPRPIPDVVLIRGEYLTWAMSGTRYEGRSAWRESVLRGEAVQAFRPARTVGSEKGMLKAFLNLHEAADHNIAEFVRRWGPLGIRRSYTDDGELVWSLDSIQSHETSEEFPDLLVAYGRDRIDHWRYWSQRFGAAIRFWSALVAGEARPSERWDAVFKEFWCDSRSGNHFRPLPAGDKYNDNAIWCLGVAFCQRDS